MFKLLKLKLIETETTPCIKTVLNEVNFSLVWLRFAQSSLCGIRYKWSMEFMLHDRSTCNDIYINKIEILCHTILDVQCLMFYVIGYLSEGKQPSIMDTITFPLG